MYRRAHLTIFERPTREKAECPLWPGLPFDRPRENGRNATLPDVRNARQEHDRLVSYMEAGGTLRRGMPCRFMSRK